MTDSAETVVTDTYHPATDFVTVIDGAVEISPQRKNFIRTRLMELHTKVGENYLEMGELLVEVKVGEYWDPWGYDSFEHWVEADLGFHRRKAAYLVSIHNTFEKALHIDRSKLAEIEWSKLGVIAPHVDEENVDTWLDVAKNSTVGELKQNVKESLAAVADDDSPIPGDDIEKFSTLTFRVVEGQADNIKTALARASDMCESDKKGHCLDMICTEFLSTYGTVGDMDAVGDLNRILVNIETFFDVKLSCTGEASYPHNRQSAEVVE